MSANCPICNVSVPNADLERHVNECLDSGVTSNTTTETAPVVDADLELALKLQAQFDQEEGNSTTTTASTQAQIPAMSDDEKLARQLAEEEKRLAAEQVANRLYECQLCKSNKVKLEELFILDTCTHKFCRGCIKEWVEKKIAVEVGVQCPLPSCALLLSLLDFDLLLPNLSSTSSSSTAKHTSPFSSLIPSDSTKAATKRLLAELKHIAKAKPAENGYSVEPIDDNLYKWEVKLFDFDKDSTLGKDMKKLSSSKRFILLHAIFPPTFPFAPPFIRVIRPRFQYRTGHVTIGGSICMELLTSTGWRPTNTMESVLLNIRAQLLVGNAKLDTGNKRDYSESEAKSAFKRMVRDHGWS